MFDLNHALSQACFISSIDVHQIYCRVKGMRVLLIAMMMAGFAAGQAKDCTAEGTVMNALTGSPVSTHRSSPEKLQVRRPTARAGGESPASRAIQSDSPSAMPVSSMSLVKPA